MPLSANDRLSLIRVKTERAKYHLDNLEVAAKTSEGLYEQRFFKYSEHHTVLYRMPVTKFSVIAGAGDVFHNLRSALDHLAWHLVLANGQTPTEYTGFPIADSAEKFIAMRRGKMAGMSTEAKQAIKALRPYKEGNHPLWLIHHWNIVDKHRHLFATGHKVLLEGQTFEGDYFAHVNEVADFHGVSASDADPQANLPNAMLEVKTEIPNTKPLLPTLHELLVFTDDLISNFEPCLGPHSVLPAAW